MATVRQLINARVIFHFKFSIRKKRLQAVMKMKQLLIMHVGPWVVVFRGFGTWNLESLIVEYTVEWPKKQGDFPRFTPPTGESWNRIVENIFNWDCPRGEINRGIHPWKE